LTAGPRLLEPVYAVEVLCPGEVTREVGDLLAARRGNVVSEAPRPGTPFTVIRGYLPVMDSFGFETDLRVATQGLAFPLQSFSHWNTVPGDPLDKGVVLRPLEACPPHALARDFMVKTRRRKGLAEDVVPTRFFSREL
jgi:U5 small nuclear ribonucleoprotein component